MQSHAYKNPLLYSKNNTLQYDFAMQVLGDLKISPADRVLDLGCGDGRVTVEIAKMAYKGCVLGTDISEKMIEHANMTYAAQENLRFLPMDTSLNIFRSQFDVVTSFNSLHWVKDQAKALQGIAQAAVVNARIILLLSHRKSAYHHALDLLCAHPKWASYFRGYISPRSFFTKEQYGELLANAGLSAVSLCEKEMTYEFNSIDELKAFFSASMANIKQIPSVLREDFLEDFCITFLKQSNCSNKHKIPLTFWCLEVFACKKTLQKTSEIKESCVLKRIPSKL